MDQNLLIYLSMVIPSLGLLAFVLLKRTPPETRRILTAAAVGLLLMDLVIGYMLYTGVIRFGA